MNAHIAILLSLLAASTEPVPEDLVYQPGSLIDAVVRGQSPVPAPGPVYDPAPVYGTQPLGTMPLSPLAQPAPYSPYPASGPAPGGISIGVHSSVQPYRLNSWTGRVSTGVIPKAKTEGRLGSFGISELDVELEYSSPFSPGWIFSFTQLFDARWWDGPADSGVAEIPDDPLTGGVDEFEAAIPGNGLPSQVFRVGWDLELAMPSQGGYSVQLAFTPSLASDFESGLDSDSWYFDGRGILFYHYPAMTVALGAGYWDRVKDRVIPYAGIILKPDAIWEWQLMFPQSRISVFMGNFGGTSMWMYTTAEYNVEAYQVAVSRTDGTSVSDRIELEDYRLMLGFRSEALQYSSFIEAGWVFSRSAQFHGATPGFDISDGFIGRAGVSF